MYEMLLDDLLDKLEQNGIDTSKIKISEESDENSGPVVQRLSRRPVTAKIAGSIPVGTVSIVYYMRHLVIRKTQS